MIIENPDVLSLNGHLKKLENSTDMSETELSQLLLTNRIKKLENTIKHRDGQIEKLKVQIEGHLHNARNLQKRFLISEQRELDASREIETLKKENARLKSLTNTKEET